MRKRWRRLRQYEDVHNTALVDRILAVSPAPEPDYARPIRPPAVVTLVDVGIRPARRRENAEYRAMCSGDVSTQQESARRYRADTLCALDGRRDSLVSGGDGLGR